MTARRPSGPPAYIKAQDAVLSLVRAERLRPGARVPSERALANSLGLSRMTVRQGMENLVRAGILARDSTSGTRVAETRITRRLDGGRAVRLAPVTPLESRQPQARHPAQARHPGVRVLAVTHDVSDQAEADDLRIPIGTAVIRVRRVRTAHSLPFCIETGIVPAAMTPGLTAQMLSKDRSIDDILIGHYGIHITERSSEISATPIGAADAKLLGMTVGTNALVYRTLARTQDGVALARIISLNHPDRVVFTTETPA